MLSSYRYKRILDSLAASGQLEVTTLAEELGCSENTIRRDLKHLEGTGRLQRVHGGAIRMDQSGTVPIDQRVGRDQRSKQIIARLTVERIPEGALVFLGAGTTTLAVAACLAGSPPVTVVTNMIDIAQVLDRDGRHRVFLAGGELATATRTTRGPETLQFVGTRLFDMAICGATGIDPEHGVMGPTDWHVALVALLVQQAHQFIVVAAASKFEQQDRYRLCDTSAIDVLVTNRRPEQHVMNRLVQRGTEILHP